MPTGSYRVETNGVQAEPFNQAEAELLAGLPNLGRHPVISLDRGQLTDQVSVTAIDLVLSAGALGDFRAFADGTRFLSQLHNDLSASQAAMTAAVSAYLAARDVTYTVFGSGPLDEIIAYRDFMGWAMPWCSTAHSGEALATRDGGDLRCYLQTDDQVFQTYETKWRGIEAMMPSLQLLDLTPYGRQETWEETSAIFQLDEAGSWWRRDGRPVAQWTRTDEPVK